MENKSSIGTFTMVPDQLLSSKKLSGNAKLIISYIMRWQIDNKVCFMSNQALCEKFGLSISTIKETIEALEDYCILKRFTERGRNEFGTYIAYRELTINQKALNEFLEAEAAQLKEASKQKKAPKSPVKIKSVPTPVMKKEVQEEPVIVPEEEPIKILTKDEAYVKLNAWVKWREEEGRMTKGKEVESIRSNILFTLNEFVITRGWAQQLKPFIDDYINENLLIKTPTKGRRAETEEEYWSRKERESQPKEEVQEEFVGADLWSGLSGF